MIEVIVGVVGIVVGVALGYLTASLRAARRGGLEEGMATDLALARSEATTWETKVAEVTQAARDREETMRAEHERYVAQVRADQDVLKEQFKALAADVLKSNNEQFLEVAGERLKRSQQANEAELAKREESVRKMVEPMAKALEEVRRQTTESDKQRAASSASLREQVAQMMQATDKLDKKATDFINTLRRSDVRGNWGEVQLRRVVELAGMVRYVDFEEQESVRDPDGKNLRPDMTVKLAGGRTIVVDSKVALSALLEAFETDDELIREQRLRAHAEQMRSHIDSLASKRYWDQFPSAPEFVVMFVPSEAFYQAAIEQKPDLQEYAFLKNVVIATPTTLVAMLRTVAHAWREDTLAKNAQQVLATGKELYDRLVTMGSHLSKVGKAIENAGKAYNDTVGSLEKRVLVTARRFGEMQEIEMELPETKRAETVIRQIAAPELGARTDEET